MSDSTINEMEHSLTGFEATVVLMSKIDKGILRKENYRLISLMNIDALKPAINDNVLQLSSLL